jgi:ADP-heptose:LPS heptosyltransferase
LNEEIISAVSFKIIDITGKFTLKELCAFLKTYRAFIGNEAEPMRIVTAGSFWGFWKITL